jgi:hypothetical protein
VTGRSAACAAPTAANAAADPSSELFKNLIDNPNSSRPTAKHRPVVRTGTPPLLIFVRVLLANLETNDYPSWLSLNDANLGRLTIGIFPSETRSLVMLLVSNDFKQGTTKAFIHQTAQVLIYLAEKYDIKRVN